MKMTFLGVSSALSDGFNSNMLIDFPNGQTLLFDSGTDIKHSLKAANRKVEEIDAIYISHLHADHCSLEWIGYYSYFILKKKIKLFIHESMVSDLWSMLKPGMDKVGDRVVGIKEYFDICEVNTKDFFFMDNVGFRAKKNKHITTPFGDMYSFGLYITGEHFSSYISSDTKYFLELPVEQFIMDWMKGTKGPLFSDCDFMNLGGVHANYNDLNKLSDEIKKKMWLYHYHDLGDKMPDVVADGFAGIVKQGQIFEL